MIIFFVSSIPSIIETKTVFGHTTVHFHPKELTGNIYDFFSTFKEGSLGTYDLNGVKHSVMADIQSYSLKSMILLSSSIFISLAFSLIFGVFFYHWKITHVLRWIMNILSIIPDFILIIFSIAVAVEFYQWTDIRIITLSPLSDSANLWFPVMILSSIPTFYLFKVITWKYEDICGDEYIRTAVSKGLGRHYIHIQHVYRNLKLYLFADLKKAISLTIGSLFIIEYLFNIRGITVFIFSEYQFQKVFISLFLLLAIATLCYFLIKLLFFILEQVFTHE